MPYRIEKGPGHVRNRGQFLHATSPCLRAGCKQSVPRCHYGRPTKKAPRRSAGPRIYSRSQHAQRGARGKIVFVADLSAPATLCRRAFSDLKLAKEELRTRTRCPSSTITPAAIVLLGRCWAMGHASRWPGWVGEKISPCRDFRHVHSLQGGHFEKFIPRCRLLLHTSPARRGCPQLALNL